jgi:hypothetical protein
VTVRYGSPDAFPYVVGVFVCRCGRTAEQHGVHAGEAPPGWVEVSDRDEGDYACPECAPRAPVSDER